MFFSEAMRYANDESVEKARGMERKFQLLPPEAGILFVGVRAVPSENGEAREFEVRLGIVRKFDVDTGIDLSKKILQEEIEMGYGITVGVYRGISGAARDDGSSTARTPAS